MTLPTPVPEAIDTSPWEPAPLPEGHNREMRIMNQSGDLNMTWDSENAEEVAAVRKTFDEKIKEGFNAYAVRHDGKKGKVIRKFDPKAEKIILAPAMSGG